MMNQQTQGVLERIIATQNQIEYLMDNASDLAERMRALIERNKADISRLQAGIKA